jgi:hypothetical protein
LKLKLIRFHRCDLGHSLATHVFGCGRTR